MEDKLTRISPDSWQQDVVKVAQLLDPCIKTSLVPDTAGKLAASDLLKKFCALYKNESDQISKSTAISSVPTSIIRSGFLKLLNKNASVDQSEVDKYLGTAPELDCKPLQWWKERREIFPTLCKPVMDVFAVCASSSESERWFSQSGRLITKSRCSLGTNSVHVSMCLKSWYGHVFAQSEAFDLTYTWA
ncbi:hypothetical protein RvY_14598 [Ramazzottius varieornatus]|uniref:HAT C-terminal dimerisation domain-containing protein n=1 Tax=Ramazzottius varieornatus TaxID=947166 RepID=A0A1D1VRW2_RAMVA|nr:hypothetical protein RvY_14598 [Ramazzottius varieornatus]